MSEALAPVIAAAMIRSLLSETKKKARNKNIRVIIQGNVVDRPDVISRDSLRSGVLPDAIAAVGASPEHIEFCNDGCLMRGYCVRESRARN